MRRFFRYFLGAAAVTAVILIVAFAVLMIPAVQKSVLTRALSGPDSEVSVEEVRIRPGSAILTDFALTTPEAQIRFESFDSRFRLGPLIFRRTVHVDSLTLSALSVEAEEPEDPPDADPWEVFEGILMEPPLDFRVDALEIDGVFRAPAGTLVEFAVDGRDITSRGDGGRIDVALNVEDETLPGDGLWFAGIDIRPGFDAEGVFQELGVDLALRESSGGDPVLRSHLSAMRTETGEEYRVEVLAPGGPNSDHAVLAAIGDWSRESGRASGVVDIDFARDRLPLDAGPDAIPDFSVTGRSEFLVSETGELHVQSETAAALSGIAARYGLPEAFDELAVDASVDLAVSQSRLSLASLDIGVSEGQGIDLARLRAPSEFAVEFPANGEWAFPDLDGPLVTVDLPGLPSELIDLFLEDLRFSADPVTARFAIHARNGRVEVETPQPLTLHNLTLAGPEGNLLEETDIRLTPSGFLSAAEFGFDLGIEASLPQASSVSLDFQSAGPLPLADTASRFRLEAAGLFPEAPFSAVTATGTLDTSHSERNPVPDLARFSVATEGTLRPETWEHLPARVDATAEVTRDSDLFSYNLDLLLPAENGTQQQPTVSAEGVAARDGSRIEGTLRSRLPDWWADSLAEADPNLGALRASADVAYEGGLSPVDLRIESATDLTVDTGLSELPGNGRFSLTTESGWRIDEIVELNAFRAAVVPEGRDRIVRLDLRQPLALQGGGSALEGLPQGDLLGIELGALRLEEWIPEALRNGLAGGDVRGGFRVFRDGDDLHLRPSGENIEIAEIRTGTFEGREIPAVSLYLFPFAQLNAESVRFGLESLVLAMSEGSLVEASLTGGMPFSAQNGEPAPITGSLAAGGDLASVKHLLGQAVLPNLQGGDFALDAELTVDPGDRRGTWSGTLAIPHLQGTTPETLFGVNVDFSGEASESHARGRVLGEIDDGVAVQDLDLTFEGDTNGNGSFPRLDVLGSSEFLDIIRLEELAGVFAREPEPGDEPAETEPPGEPDPLEALLPVDLRSEFTVTRMRVLPEFHVSDVVVDITGDDETIDLRRARVRFLDEAEIEVTGILSGNRETVSFVSTGRATNIDIANLLRQTQGVADPDIEGLFAFDYEVSSRAPDLRALPRNIDGLLNVSGRQGRLRVSVPDARMERIRRLAGMQEGAIGSAIARIAGAPPGVQALAESINLLTDIPYDSLDVRMGMAEGRTLVVERLDLAGPYLYASGTGRLDDVDFDAVDETRLDLRVELGARGGLQEQFRILRLLSDQRNEYGYQMLRQRPVAITGTVGDPNLREVWDLLIQAGAGAATARDEPAGDERRRDPVEDAVEGVRDLFGW